MTLKPKTRLLAVLFITLAFVFSPFAISQRLFQIADTLSRDPAITCGKFDNGLTYYIRVNKKPEKRAELRLAVKTGSVMEDDDQLGIAHFCEHMAFNGTRSFPKNEIVSLLEKDGVRLGPDVNAYTSFDETVYMLQIPTDSAQLMEKAFKILEEWASAVTYDSAEIDKERGVVIEEWRLGRGASARLQDKHLPKLLYNSRYAKRYVIGKKEILESASYETIRRFYRDWYRPELMAVVAVGDFDKTAMERLIADHFSKLTNRRPARERITYPVPAHAEPLASVASDKELPAASLQVIFKRQPQEELTAGDYRRSIVGQVYDGMFNDRLQERLQKPNPPFIVGGGSDGHWLGHTQAYTLFAQMKENTFLESLEFLLTETNRVQQYGFTATELDRQKSDRLRWMERAYKERDKTESRRHADEYVRNFLQGEPIPGIEGEFALTKQFLPGITLEEVNQVSRTRMANSSRVVTLSLPDKEGVKVPTESDVLAVFDKASTRKTEAYVDNVSTKPLLANFPKAGKIVHEKTIASLGLTEWKLSNGALVVLKPTDFKNDEILLSAYSNGGSSLASDADYLSAAMSSQLVNACGVGEFDAVTLNKMLSGKVVSVNPAISSLTEGFTGNASPQDLETLFQLTYLYATVPRKDTSAFGALMSRMKASLQNRSASPEAVFADTVTVTMTQHHYRSRPMTPALLDELNLDKALAFYKDRFADAGDFTFFFVGSFTLDKIRPLVEQYLASLPAIGRHETWRDVGGTAPKGVVNKEVYRGIEPKSSVMMAFTGPFDWSHQNRYDLTSLIEMLNIRLREVLREEKSGTYGGRAQGSSVLYPRKEYGVSISWGCNPARAGELVKTVVGILDSLKMEKPAQEYIDKVKEIQRRNHEVNTKENRYWLSNLRFYYSHGEDPEEILSYGALVDKLSAAAMQEAAKKYFDMNNVVKVVLFPEKQ
jgi:zinc protease